MSRRVVISGLGVVSSIGIGWREFWDNLLKGKSGISPISSLDTSNQFTHNGGEVKHFRPEEFIPEDKIFTLSRASQFGLAAAKLAIQDANLSDELIANTTIGTCVGLTSGPIQVIEHINDKLLKNEELTSDLAGQLPVNTA